MAVPNSTGDLSPVTSEGHNTEFPRGLFELAREIIQRRRPDIMPTQSEINQSMIASYPELVRAEAIH